MQHAVTSTEYVLLGQSFPEKKNPHTHTVQFMDLLLNIVFHFSAALSRLMRFLPEGNTCSP